MVTLKTLDSSILALIVLILIYLNAYNRLEKGFTNYRLFMALVQANMALLILDILAWIFNGLPGSLYTLLNTGFNLLLYITLPIAPIIWILYANFQVFNDESQIDKLKRFLFPLFLIIAAVSLISLYTGWFFSVDDQNIYHRGSYFLFYVLFCFALLMYPLSFIFANRHLIRKSEYYSLVLFIIPIMLGATAQICYYGVSFIWSGMALSLVVLYFYIQDRGLNTDYLTGVYNRRYLDRYIKGKIRNSREGKTFSAILIDLDKFKQINDTWGHDVGDEALQDTVRILKECVRNSDFIARYGGDEFLIIIDISTRYMLEQTIERIKACLERFNKDSQKPYKLSFGIGYDVYDDKTKMKTDDFFRHIDTLMYHNKNTRC
ncbi:GGDEF domain-containing protein [Candidatus Formimonas warabiya]|uniref:GGDEF domain-containing protein n=1 Tax=Formimonas warabiya TaxID=1761012 RepID=A0A3G1KR32_FORW1|nr:GGDEF domain-containing protein [Candidatus Formimonas warabiya]ATW24565.1 hypothetical protein DCMF_07000 [Candidatus Formimonas warabiya]